MQQQFRRRFRVRRRVIEQWLDYLSHHHPGYRDFTLNRHNLSLLPEDDSIFDQLHIQEVADIGGISADAGPVDEVGGEDANAYDEAAVPNMLANQSELDQLRAHLDPEFVPSPQIPLHQDPREAHHLPMPSIRRTPIDEFNHSQALFSLACPSLFPKGLADFVEPRQRSISYQEYIEHAMRWKDGRFARHHNFRYIALNTLMRHQARGHSKFYVNKHHRGQPISKEDLRKALEDPDTPEAQALLNRISRYAGSLKGTRPFWYRRKHECEAFAHCLDTPSAFMTLSPADLHWWSLYQHMPDFDRWKTLDEKPRMSLSRRLLRENPHIAAWHFYSRNKLFRDIVLTRKFNLEDFWSRFEWQGRGSSHSHGLYWFGGSPPPDMSSERSRAEFARIWGYHVTAMNPKPETIGQGGNVGNPLSPNPAEMNVTWEWLNSIVNRCQRHHCSSLYCLRVNKKAAKAAKEKGEPTPEPTCRFYYPKEMRDAPALATRAGRNWWFLDPQRNDTHLNQYNPLVSLCWLANIDISPCTSVDAVINYAAKYCSKVETATSTYTQITKSILPLVSDTSPMLSFVSKIMNKLISKKDYSAQEVCHILYGLPLQKDSRVVQSVNCRPPDKHTRAMNVTKDADEIEESSTAYDKYLSRPQAMDSVSYFEFLKNWNFLARNSSK